MAQGLPKSPAAMCNEMRILWPLDAVNKNYVLLFTMSYPHGQAIRLAAVYFNTFQVAVTPTNMSACLFSTP